MFKKAFGTFTDAVKASAAAFTDDQPQQTSSRNLHQQQQQPAYQRTAIPKSSSTFSTTSASSTGRRQSYAPPEADLDLSGLSEEEKAIIMAINAKAAMVDEGDNRARVEVREESRGHSTILKDSLTTTAKVESSYGYSTAGKEDNKQVDELSKEEREHIESVINKANDEESTNLTIFGNKLLKSSPLGKMAEKLITNETAKETFKQLSNVKSDLEKNYNKMVEKTEILKKSDKDQEQVSKISPSSSVHSGDFLEKFEEAGGEFGKKMVKKLNIGQNLHKFKDSDVFAQATGALDKFSHFVTDNAPSTVNQSQQQQQQVDLSGLSEEEAAQILSVMAKADQLIDSQPQQPQKSIFDENLKEDAKKLTSLATKSSKEAFSFLKDSMSNIVDSALDVKVKTSGSKFDITPTKDTKWFHESIQDDKEYQPEEPVAETTAAEDKLSPRSSSQETEGADENNEEEVSSQGSETEPAKLQEETPVAEEVYSDHEPDIPLVTIEEPKPSTQGQQAQPIQQFEYNVELEDGDQKNYYPDDEFDKDEYIQYCYDDQNVEYTQTAVPIVVCPPTPMPPHLSEEDEESMPPESPRKEPKRDADIYVYESPPVSDESDRELSYLRDDVLSDKGKSTEDFREDSSDEDERANAVHVSDYDTETQDHLFKYDESETFREIQQPSYSPEEKAASRKSSLQFESSADTYFKPYATEDSPYDVEEVKVERRHSSIVRPHLIETEVDSHHRRSLPDSHASVTVDNGPWSQTKPKSLADGVRSYGSESSYETEDTGYISNTSPFEDENKDFGYEPSYSQVAIPDTIAEDDYIQHSVVEQEDFPQRTAASFNPFLSEDVEAPRAPDIPGFPDLDLSSFNEEERQHLIAMFCKASEMDKEVEHRAVVQPKPAVTSASIIQARQLLPLDISSVPIIKEIQPTPEPLFDERAGRPVAEAFDEISQPYDKPLAALPHQQQYDSSEVSSDVNDDEEEMRRINEIEMELANKQRQAREAKIVKTCPLCQKTQIEFVKDDSENLTGQKCGYCSTVVCTQCGYVCSVPIGGNQYTSLWLCKKCADKSDAAVVQGRQSLLEKINDAEMKVVEDHDQYTIDSMNESTLQSRIKDTRQTIKIATSIGSGNNDFDSDESDEEIDTSDDDYPDEVIEVPPVVVGQGQNGLLDEETTKLIEKQDEYGSDVLAEITKTFASSAANGQTFDVDEMYKKSKDILISQKSVEKMATTTSDQKQSTNPFDEGNVPPPPIPARSTVNQPLPLPAYQPKPQGGKFEENIRIYDEDIVFEDNRQPLHVAGDPSSPKTYYHTNLDYDEINESPKDHRALINEEEVDTSNNTEEEIDYAQAMRYYNSQPFYTHRSGPVYTIPEDEEESEEVKATSILPRAAGTTSTGKDTSSTKESSSEKQLITWSTESIAASVATLVTTATVVVMSTDIPAGTKPAYKDVTSVVSSKQYFEAYKSVQPSIGSSGLYHVAGQSVQAVISAFPSAAIPPPPPPPQQYVTSASNENAVSKSDTFSTIHHPQEDNTSDQVISKLKRSPAMILHSNGTPISGPEQCLPRLLEQSHDFSQGKMTPKKDDQAISKIAEMGRRKLPNIPQGMQSSTSQLMSSEDYGHQRQWRSVSDASFLESESTATGSPSSTVVFRPQSSIEIQQQQSTTERAGLVRCKSVPGKSVPLFSGAKIPVTLARVLLKQELREALLRRSVQLEACEIEANQRQYNIHRHLLTGIYPRSVGLDSVPPKTKCSLPQQLVEGCHIEYKKPMSSSTTMLSSSSKYTEYSSAPIQRPYSSSMQTLPYRSSVASDDYSTRINASTQFDSAVTSGQLKHLVSGSSQTFAQDEDAYRAFKIASRPITYSHLSPKLKDADTQTKTFINAASSTSFDNSTISYADYCRRRSSAAYGTGSRSVGTCTSETSSENKRNWTLESRIESKQVPRMKTTSTNTDKQQADQYLDTRKGRKHQKHRKAISAMDYFSDDDEDDQLTREIRKSKILGEIERRREKLLKQTLPYGAGYSSTAFDPRLGGPGASDYSSHIPHYGSLPRMDAYHRSTSYGQDYRSLPRGGAGYDPYSVCGALGSRHKVHPMYHSDLGYLSDLQDYGLGDRMRDYRDNIMNVPSMSYDPYGQRFASRSLPYLDQLDRYHTDPSRLAPKPIPPSMTDSVSRYQPESGFLSQYANYLNEQFLNRPLDDPSVWNSPAAAATTGIQSTSAYAPSQYMGSNYDVGRNYPVAQTAYNRYPQDTGASGPGSSLRSYQNLGPSSTLSRLSSGWTASPYEQRLMDTYNYDLRPQPRSNNIPTHSYPYQYKDGRYNVSSSAPTLLPDVGYGGLSQQYPVSRTYQQQQQYPEVDVRRQNGYSYSGRPLSTGPLSFGGQQTYAGPTDINDLYRRTGSAPLQQPTDYQNLAQFPMQSAQPKGQLNQHVIGQQTSTPRTTWQEGRPIITSGQTRPSGSGGLPFDVRGQQQTPHFNVNNVVASSRNNLPTTSPANYRFQTKQPNRGAIKRILLTRDPKDKYSKGGGLGMKIIGGKISQTGELVAYVARVYDRGLIGTLEEVREGDQILEWNGIPLTGKTYEEVQAIINESYGEIEIIINSGANLHRHQSTSNPAVIPTADSGYVSTGLLDGKASPCFSSTPPQQQPGLQSMLLKQQQLQSQEPITGELCLRVTFDDESGTLFVNVQSARNLKPISKTQSPNAFVKIYLLPRRIVENKRRTKFVPNNRNPDWNQTAVYKDLTRDHLRDSFLEFTVWHLDQTALYGNEFLGQVVLSLSEPSTISNIPKWYPLSSQMLRSHRHNR